jgi:hypothetical protein
VNIKYIIDPLNLHVISKIVFKGKGRRERQKKREGEIGI